MYVSTVAGDECYVLNLIKKPRHMQRGSDGLCIMQRIGGGYMEGRI